MNSYPIYIISKGRWENRLTVKSLDVCGIDYKIVIEPQEYDDYSKVIAPEKILILPFSNLGQGSIPARNWVWEHSVSQGALKHWILDDNIFKFMRLNNNKRIQCRSKYIFKICEDFVDRYENIALSGMNYQNFAHDRVEMPPYKLNTRIYSCILIKNDIPYRWRGKYNEDTDLSIRALKDGYCTLLFNALLIDKTGTMRNKGGNTEELYMETDNRREFAESLAKQHPDVVKVTKKFGRWHHLVNYKSFSKNKPVKKDFLDIPNVINNYGMRLEKIK